MKESMSLMGLVRLGKEMRRYQNAFFRCRAIDGITNRSEIRDRAIELERRFDRVLAELDGPQLFLGTEAENGR